MSVSIVVCIFNAFNIVTGPIDVRYQIFSSASALIKPTIIVSSILIQSHSYSDLSMFVKTQEGKHKP